MYIDLKRLFSYIYALLIGICYNEVLLHDVDQCNFNDLIILKLNLRKEDIKKELKQRIIFLLGLRSASSLSQTAAGNRALMTSRCSGNDPILNFEESRT